ncbi:helix-turn-helix domain-containing protein [Actinoplanes sp. TBRC 11911]|uniref:helix-turn-helix transcriptional regulator n=1 Tax=Actinoplanes sp. TBRC 11911 TaxID=2729386 RepID=UPI00145FBFFB|nr:LuxR family transcriptional regulator [Actinoplanes sp. TBRC 11911]NMO52868.1 helix-turn-helix domain-containing protein [Actinoplanes sp. TBRC 11911]
MRTLERNDTFAGRVRLAGRDDDRLRVRTLLDDPMPGGGALVLLGEPGVGKSALLTDVAATFAAEGARTLLAAGVPFEPDVSYAALHQLLFDAHDAFDRLDEAHRAALRTALGLAGGPVPSRILVSNAVLLLVRAIAADRPLLLLVDDLHWVDPASAKVLCFVSRRLGGSGVRFLGAARPGGTRCSDVGALPQYRLAPLPERAAYELLAERFPALAPGVRRRVVTEAAGNPLALLELPDTISEAQPPPVLPLTDRLAARYAGRIRDLPGPCRWTLLLGALGGRDAVRAASWDHLETLAPAERDHLVSVAPDGREFTFRNSLIRAAVVAVATAEDRRRAHHALAAALSAPPERRAGHLGEATAGPDENVAGLLERAAERRHARGDPQGAAADLARAAELSPEPIRRARRLALAAYLGTDAAGEIDIAERFAELARRQVVADSGGAARADLARRATRPRNTPARFNPLTPKEREIAELAACGMSNKEIGERLFLSHRTIGSHLYQIFPKLGLTSRAGLRDALTELSRR